MVDRNAWTQPGCYEQAPGVFRIPLPLPDQGLKAVNVYAVADGDEVVMIDGGWAMDGAQEQLAAALDTIGYGLDGIREFLVTHLHRDHYSNAIAVRRGYGTPVAIGEGEQACLAAIHQPIRHSFVTQLVAAGALDLLQSLSGNAPDPADLDIWEDPDRWLPDGVDLALKTRTLRVIATPGHTRGHVVFHDAEANTLFAGDHLLPHITPSIGLEPLPAESPLRDFLNSLRLVKQLPDAALLPAHGPAVPSTHARVDELLDHHEQRLTATADAVAAGASTGYEVAERLTWTRRHRPFADLDPLNQGMAVHETMAHLVVLAERGWLRRSTVDGVEHFARA